MRPRFTLCTQLRVTRSCLATRALASSYPLHSVDGTAAGLSRLPQTCMTGWPRVHNQPLTLGVWRARPWPSSPLSSWAPSCPVSLDCPDGRTLRSQLATSMGPEAMSTGSCSNPAALIEALYLRFRCRAHVGTKQREPLLLEGTAVPDVHVLHSGGPLQRKPRFWIIVIVTRMYACTLAAFLP